MNTELTREERSMLSCNLDTLCDLCGEPIGPDEEFCKACIEGLEDLILVDDDTGIESRQAAL